MISTTYDEKQNGNVLFLILIAVALFAALSYVVTQSTRSGSGSSEREKNILNAAQMTQYPTTLRTAIVRMVLGGVSVENLKFNAPGGFGSVSAARLVFHPQGGGATFQQASAELSAAGNVPLPWFYNANFHVPGIGIDDAGGNDLIAFLPGISSGACRQVNDELGLNLAGCLLTNGAPTISGSINYSDIADSLEGSDTLPPGPGPSLQGQNSGGTCEAFSRQASGCFSDGTRNIFFSVLLER